MEKVKVLKNTSITSFVLSGVCLLTGALFHFARSQTENKPLYDLGVVMGIAMASCFALFLLIGLTTLFIWLKKRKKNS